LDERLSAVNTEKDCALWEKESLKRQVEFLEAELKTVREAR